MKKFLAVCLALAAMTIGSISLPCENQKNHHHGWWHGCNGNKVEICKVPPGNPSNSHTICISKHALKAQLKTGSYLGPCVENDTETQGTGTEEDTGENNTDGTNTDYSTGSSSDVDSSTGELTNVTTEDQTDESSDPGDDTNSGTIEIETESSSGTGTESDTGSGEDTVSTGDSGTIEFDSGDTGSKDTFSDGNDTWGTEDNSTNETDSGVDTSETGTGGFDTEAVDTEDGLDAGVEETDDPGDNNQDSGEVDNESSDTGSGHEVDIYDLGKKKPAQTSCGCSVSIGHSSILKVVAQILTLVW